METQYLKISDTIDKTLEQLGNSGPKAEMVLLKKENSNYFLNVIFDDLPQLFETEAKARFESIFEANFKEANDGFDNENLVFRFFDIHLFQKALENADPEIESFIANNSCEILKGERLFNDLNKEISSANYTKRIPSGSFNSLTQSTLSFFNAFQSLNIELIRIALNCVRLYYDLKNYNTNIAQRGVDLTDSKKIIEILENMTIIDDVERQKFYDYFIEPKNEEKLINDDKIEFITMFIQNVLIYSYEWFDDTKEYPNSLVIDWMKSTIRLLEFLPDKDEFKNQLFKLANKIEPSIDTEKKETLAVIKNYLLSS